MAPRKDYEDYTKFINDAYNEEKSQILNKTLSCWNRRTSSTTKERGDNEALSFLTPIKAKEKTISRQSERAKFNRTFSTMTANERKLGSTFTNFNMKPVVLEKKMGET